MNEDTKTQPADAGRRLSEGLGPLVEFSQKWGPAATHGAYPAWQRELMAAIEAVLAAERERWASACRGAIHAAAEAGNAEAMRLISELHQRLIGPNVRANPDKEAKP